MKTVGENVSMLFVAGITDVLSYIEKNSGANMSLRSPGFKTIYSCPYFYQHSFIYNP